MRGEPALLHANEVGLDPSRVARPSRRRMGRGNRRAFAAALLSLSSAAVCAAQTASQAAQDAQAVPAAQTAQTDVTVGRFTVEDADPKFAADADRILSTLRGHPVAVEAIQAAAAEIQRIYVDHGRFLTLVSVPSQDVAVGGE